ncbi:MAG: DNA repair protein RadC [Thermoplasmata archaeon]|nr:DNA repair protein RadC [Thermoplasmata archaeon]
MTMLVREMPARERPRERLVANGPEVLSDTELLAIVLNTGASGSVLDLASSLLAAYDGRLRRLLNADVHELCALPGIGVAKACQLRAVGELACRADREVASRSMACPRDAAAFLIPRMRDLDRERLVVLCLDVKNRIIDGIERTVSIGALDSSPVRPREVFRMALLRNAASIVLAHNHPSGDPEPSASDVAATKRIAEAGEELGIELLDHVVIGDGRYVSMKDRGHI